MSLLAFRAGRRFDRRVGRHVGAACLFSSIALTSGCGGKNAATTGDAATDASFDGGDDAGVDGGDDSSGTYCPPPDDTTEIVRFMPTQLVLAPGETRSVRVFIEPDVCGPTPIPVTIDNAATATFTGTFTADVGTSETNLMVTGGAVGTATMTATFGMTTATVAIDVRATDDVACGDPLAMNIAPGTTATTSWGATLAVVSGASRVNTPDNNGQVNPFDATISCTAVAATSGQIALGPAVTFGPQDKKFLRMINFEIPINPAKMPPTANLRHVRVLYDSPSLTTPRVVPVSNMAIEPRGADWVLRFEAPRLGTYQAIVASDAGTHTRTRHLTHRAVVGFSMGGIGASLFGMNHHDLFDVVAPLGGPFDSSWFLWQFDKYHFGGFCPRNAGDPIPTTPCHADVGPVTEPYMHVQDFEHWWHMNGVSGTGGTFGRDSYVQIMRDVSSAWGDPLGNNAMADYVAPGITTPAPFSETSGADYCNDATKSLVAKGNFYDGKFNPDGSLPVIRFCDGANDPSNAGIWASGGTAPFEVSLAVDLNGNGTRDSGEPVLSQGEEPYSDFGVDGLADVNEPGYDAVNLPDPNGDDYDPQYNPLGTEGNHQYDVGEAFQDVGIDGVTCPTGKTCPFDVGEGDGKFSMSDGVQQFFARDARLQIEGRSPAPVGGAWDQAAFDRLDYYSDGGIRDIFNWGVIGQHFVGAFVSGARGTTYFDNWEHLPNAPISDSDLFDTRNVDWSTMPQSVYMRYGSPDATDVEVNDGDGQHVGDPDQLLRRVQTALYYIGSRWPDADRAYIEDPEGTAGASDCVVGNSCDFMFTDSHGRTGPTALVLPPGYHTDSASTERYPVVYFLHGYGQTVDDLLSTVLFLRPFMVSGTSSRATRLQKAIFVFVDGHCAAGECINGTFYTNSARSTGPQIDDYFQDLIKYMDANYRTMGPVDVTVND